MTDRERVRERELGREREREREREWRYIQYNAYSIYVCVYVLYCVSLPVCIVRFDENISDKDRLR